MKRMLQLAVCLILLAVMVSAAPAGANDLKDFFLGSDGAYINVALPGADLSLQVFGLDRQMMLFPRDAIQGSTDYSTFDNVRIGVPRGMLLHGIVNPHYEQDKVGRLTLYLAGTPMEVIKTCQDDTPLSVFNKVFDEAVSTPRTSDRRPRQAAYCVIDRYAQFVINTNRIPAGGFTVEANVEQRDKPRLKASGRVTFFVTDPVVRTRFLGYRDVTGDTAGQQAPNSGQGQPIPPENVPVVVPQIIPPTPPPTICTPPAPQSAPACLIGVLAQGVASTYGVVPQGETSYSHEFRSTGARGVNMPFLAVVLDAYGNPDLAASISVVRRDSGGNVILASKPGFRDGAIYIDKAPADQFISLFVNGREITSTIDSANGLLPWHTRTGIGGIVYVRSGQ